MRRLVQVLALLVLLAAARAEARPQRFFGAHPLPASVGGGYCYLPGVHLHAFAPDHGSLYARVPGLGSALVFTGDPTPFGYDGPRVTYYGNHPLPPSLGLPPGEPVYCYIEGPHAHAFAAPSSPEWREQGDVVFYVGPYAPVYQRERPVRQRAYRAIYAPYEAQRPTVVVTPPPEWHGEVWQPGVHVQANVAIPAPPPVRVDVQIGAPPPAPRPVVVVPAPYIPPPRPIVVAPPRPIIVEPAPRYYEEERREHHDNDKHKGWYKHGHGRD